MRLAYETAISNAYLFCGAATKPVLLGVDDIVFHRPVAIGCGPGCVGGSWGGGFDATSSQLMAENEA